MQMIERRVATHVVTDHRLLIYRLPAVTNGQQKAATTCTRSENGGSSKPTRPTRGLRRTRRAKMLDKCRAELADKGGDYHFNCPKDQVFFRFTEIDPQKLREFVATGASDEEVAHWIELNSKVQDPGKIATWVRLFRLNPFTLLLDLDDWIHTRRAARKG
jgi:Domain of unknown function (DUF5069)